MLYTICIGISEEIKGLLYENGLLFILYFCLADPALGNNNTTRPSASLNCCSHITKTDMYRYFVHESVGYYDYAVIRSLWVAR